MARVSLSARRVECRTDGVVRSEAGCESSCGSTVAHVACIRAQAVVRKALASETGGCEGVRGTHRMGWRRANMPGGLVRAAHAAQQKPAHVEPDGPCCRKSRQQHREEPKLVTQAGKTNSGPGVTVVLGNGCSGNSVKKRWEKRVPWRAEHSATGRILPLRFGAVKDLLATSYDF